MYLSGPIWSVSQRELVEHPVPGSLTLQEDRPLATGFLFTHPSFRVRGPVSDNITHGWLSLCTLRLLCASRCAQCHMCFISFEPHTANVLSILNRRKWFQRSDRTGPTSHSLEVVEPRYEHMEFGSLTS